MRHAIALVLLASIQTMTSNADTLSVSFTAVADAAWSYSTNDPQDHLRAYSTQPSRDREIGLLQGFAAVNVTSEHVRARLAIQEGWFCRANYTGADSSWRMLQEARVGVEVLRNVWLDAGIMFSHIGYESMIARDNLTLSRSLTADYTPYYCTGLAATWAPDSTLSISLLLLNGWQQIVDVNDELAAGTRLVVRPNKDLTINWSTFCGNEQPTQDGSRIRFHNNVWVELRPAERLTIAVLGDVGLQQDTANALDQQWAVGVIGAWSFSEQWRAAGRVERFSDPSQIYVTPLNGSGFDVSGASVNLDYRPYSALLLRSEARLLHALQPVFPTSYGFGTTDLFFTLSLSLGI